MITIYHNPRCSKSRQGLALLQESGKSFDVVKYLETPFTKATLAEILNKLDIPPIALVRTNESIWKTEYKGKSLSDGEIIEAMVKHPKLIERPIVVHGDKAVIGRPPEQISGIL